MPPLPDVTHEIVILSSASTTAALNGFQSSDELEQTMFTGQDMYHRSLAVDPMESINLSDDEEPPTLTEEPIPQPTTCSAPSTPTGERDPSVIFRKLTTTTSNISTLPEVEVLYQGVRSSGSTNSDDNNGLLDTFFGCFKPFFSAMNKIGGNMKYSKNTANTLSRINDDWDIPIDNIRNDLVLIGTGIEGTVYLGKLAGQNVACKRVKSKEETNIKHLKKLNHINVIKFRGVSVASPLFYIVMDYCAYGSLYDVLKRRREKDSYTKPTQVLDWSRQISNGVDYLHSNKIVHRDLKSPNILIADKNILKISDFGTSKELVNRRSQIMSFNGTSAWMAPEVIRQEPCSEKVDVWSFGIVLWEILTCAVPYHNIDPTAVMWGVGKGSLTLPIPSSAPEGFKLLMTWCWNQQPSCRPLFQQITKHLDMSEPKIKLFEQEQEYVELKRIWSDEINEYLSTFPTIDISSTLQMSNDELMKKRQEELQHIADIRSHYQKRIQDVNKFYIELKSLKMQLKQREREIREKERLLNIHGNKRIIHPITEARKKSLEIIKAATANLNDPKHFLSLKKRYTNKSNNGSSNCHPSITSDQSTNNPAVTNNEDLSNTKSSQRRKKGSSHRRNNSNGSATSWTPPNLSAIADQEKKRASINKTSNVMGETFTTNRTSTLPSETAPIPSISADIDSKSNANNRELNPKNLKIDLQNPINSSISSPIQQRPPTTFSNPLRKSSSSSPEDNDDAQHPNPPKPRRRRNNNRITSSNSSQTDELDKKSQLLEAKSDDVRKSSRNVTFQLSPSLITERNSSIQQRKLSKSLTYTSSEEGEAEETQSDDYILDDKKHRDKHQSSETFSSESEIYGEKKNRSSLKNDGVFSDEGGHISDDRPASRESMVHSEPDQD